MLNKTTYVWREENKKKKHFLSLVYILTNNNKIFLSILCNCEVACGYMSTSAPLFALKFSIVEHPQMKTLPFYLTSGTVMKATQFLHEMHCKATESTSTSDLCEYVNTMDKSYGSVKCFLRQSSDDFLKHIQWPCTKVIHTMFTEALQCHNVSYNFIIQGCLQLGLATIQMCMYSKEKRSLNHKETVLQNNLYSTCLKHLFCFFNESSIIYFHSRSKSKHVIRPYCV